ncbi:MAG: ribbon-helix-helix protein, CopG family [Acidobacteria bacterium]|nr:MAG: ribbon-helix-helix protein, CopG family [Acidobacteriota bacterium]
MRSERINLLVTPEEKAAIEAQAAALNLSTSDMMRRAVASYDPEFDESELQALADELSLVVAATEESLDTALRQFDALGAFLADKASLRRAARAAHEAEGVVWPFEGAPT